MNDENRGIRDIANSLDIQNKVYEETLKSEEGVLRVANSPITPEKVLDDIFRENQNNLDIVN